MICSEQKGNFIRLKDILITDHVRLRKVIKAAALSNMIEWFDLSVYGFLTYVLGGVFFPESAPGMQRVAILATFSIPFFIRPLGGWVFGVLGDKYGRQKILSITIIIMSLSTTCIGLIPSYHSIGILAPISLLLCKVMQGFSVGGEYIGASIFVAEYSPDRKRGLVGSWLDFSSIAGFMLGAALVVLISFITGTDYFLQCGWRILFFMALPLGVIGLYFLRNIEDTPVFKKHIKNLNVRPGDQWFSMPTVAYLKMSFKKVLSEYWGNIFICIGLVITTNITYYMLLTYMPSYLSHNLNYSEDHSVKIMIVLMAGMLLLQPVMGLMSDRFGRRPLVIIGSSMLLFCAIPCFILINSGIIWLMYSGFLVLSTILNSFTGVMASVLPALFPIHIRYSVLATSFNISILIASFTPTFAAWLVEVTHNLYIPAYYLMIAGAIGLCTGIMMRETANLPLSGSVPIASDIEEAKEILNDYYDYIEKKIIEIKQQITSLEEKRSHLINQHPDIQE
ncbi:glycine betaine/L-proline transporter ProP [Candidatus Erwinia haradaeae]|uniref:Proline/betaine transporter n=1 Tax=Candidatus Erwinia haradaeae TaxID=1922217 RepID=A0A451D3E0_9GAMM|nr:glycine betaine/L-proline transporter ProP [Candidatus Erwinia haradaeae]VFP80200.1 Proline/betaine transporter [Candidatus Erwinia haradaeae]